MSFGVPLGLLALLSLPALVALYFLRRRQPPRRVSALFLWRSPDERAESGPKLERFSRELSLLLECLAAICAALFLADLRCGQPPELARTVAVLDSSLSMSAKDASGTTAMERALTHLEALGRRESGRVTVIASGPRPKLVGAPAMPVERLRQETVTASAGSHDLAASFALARELAGGGRVRLYTDALPETVPDFVEVIAVGAPDANVAFTGASRRERGGRSVIALRVANLSAQSSQPLVRLLDESGGLLREERLELAPGADGALRVELTYPGAIVAELPDDALPADNRVRLLPEPRSTLKVSLGSAAAEPIRRYLAADGRASVGAPADLAFTGASNGSSAPWTVAIGSSGESKGFVAPFFADKGHRLLEDVDFEGAVWFAGPNPPGLPLLTVGNTVLLSESEGPVFHLNLDVQRSNLHRLGAFPILLSNLFALRREALPGFPRRNLALGEELPVTLDGGAKWTLDGPDGSTSLRGTGTVRLPPPSPGVYTLMRDGAAIAQASVNPIAPDESDLRGRGSGQRASAVAVATSGDAPQRPRNGWPLFAMLLLLAADWWLTGLGGMSRGAARPPAKGARA